MVELSTGLLLYHGSYCEVNKPDLNMCAKRKDFGRGFYLTSSKQQAVNFLHTSIVKAISSDIIETGQNYGIISCFEMKNNHDLRVHVFEQADIDWLHCVAAHRKRGVFPDIEKEMSKYDIIVGKIADDATNATLTAYITGAFGIIGSEEADDFCIRQLLPNKLKDQFCFKTDAALNSLEFKGSEQVWLNR